MAKEITQLRHRAQDSALGTAEVAGSAAVINQVDNGNIYVTFDQLLFHQLDDLLVLYLHLQIYLT